MPWKETSPMTERRQCIEDAERGLYAMSELCERYGISRKTGYKWLERYLEHGRSGLADRSRAPASCPHRMAPEVAEAICDARQRHPSWGPRKLLDWLGPRRPDLELPAASTAGDLLLRQGMVKKRVRRTRHLHPGMIPAVSEAPNDLWTVSTRRAPS